MWTLFFLLLAASYCLVVLIALVNLGVFVLCLRSKQRVSPVPLVVSLLGAGVVVVLSPAVPFPLSPVVLPLVLLAQRYRGRRVPELVANH